jgi:hypothetical protein
LFRREKPARNSWAVIFWWESRRIPYNVIVGLAGVLTGVLLLVNATVAERVLGDPIGLPSPPLFALMGVILYGVMANVCFTGGWVVEILRRSFRKQPEDSFAEAAFTNGTIFSVLLTLLPAALILIYTAAFAPRTASPQTYPSKAELVGRYVLTETPSTCRSDTGPGDRAATVQLEADGSFQIDGLPSCFADDRPPATRLAGTVAGEWEVEQVDGKYVLALLVKSGALQHGWNLGVEIRGRAAPFELYFWVGDPDERKGLVYTRS